MNFPLFSTFLRLFGNFTDVWPLNNLFTTPCWKSLLPVIIYLMCVKTGFFIFYSAVASPIFFCEIYKSWQNLLWSFLLQDHLTFPQFCKSLKDFSKLKLGTLQLHTSTPIQTACCLKNQTVTQTMNKILTIIILIIFLIWINHLKNNKF